MLSESTRERIESFIDDCLIEDDLPGMSVALVSEDDMIYSNGFGARDLSTNKPMTPDTLYGIGSCTKSFTTLAIMQLAEDGTLDPEDPVNDYVDIYDDAPGDSITVHDLMCHGSGMPSDATALALIMRYVADDAITVPLSSGQDFDRHVRGSVDRRVTDREDPFFYYNSGYTVLGEIIETATGDSYREYVQENILDPLGMDRSTFDKAAVEADEDALTGYHKDEGELVEGEFPHDRIVDAPGGLLSSVNEMASYLRLQMNGGEYAGNRLLSQDGIAAMHTPYTTRETRLDGTVLEYGYGWMLQDFLDDRLVEHGGTITVSTGYMGFLEDAGLGVAVGCNTASAIHPMYVGPAVLALAVGEKPTEVPFFALREKVKRVEGEYASYRNLFEASVESNGATLTLSARDDQYELFPTSTDPNDLTFETVVPSGGKVPVEFKEYDGGVDLFFQRWRLRQNE